MLIHQEFYTAPSPRTQNAGKIDLTAKPLTENSLKRKYLLIGE